MEEDENLMKVKAKDEKDIYYVIGKSQMDKYDKMITLVIILVALLIAAIIVGIFVVAFTLNWFDATNWFYRFLLAVEGC